ncbi:hypothetical protein [Mesorhizobium sp. M0011]|uniref:hypothetical protein n=1 Tax=Mesorhizobium sp. M0011 TaxID=2956839 RepID=UPI003338CCBE
MGKHSEVDFLLDLRFPKYTTRIRERVLKAMKAAKKPDVSDEVVDLVRAELPFRSTSMWADPQERAEALASLSKQFCSLSLDERKRERWRRYIDDACGYEGDLLSMDDDQLLEIANGKRREMAANARAEAVARALELDRWAFFSQPAADADFRHWLAMPSWSADEAVALSLGKDPRIVSSATLARARKSVFRQDYEMRMEQFRRAILLGDLTEAIRPSDLSGLGKRLGMNLPHEIASLHYSEGELLKVEISMLNEKIRELLAENARLKNSDDFDRIPTRSKRSLLKILLGIAIKKYRYRPGHRSGAAQKIAGDLLEFEGLKLEEDAINSWLTTAVDELEYSARAEPSTS